MGEEGEKCFEKGHEGLGFDFAVGGCVGVGGGVEEGGEGPVDEGDDDAVGGCGAVCVNLCVCVCLCKWMGGEVTA